MLTVITMHLRQVGGLKWASGYCMSVAGRFYRPGALPPVRACCTADKAPDTALALRPLGRSAFFYGRVYCKKDCVVDEPLCRLAEYRPALQVRNG